MYILIDQKVCSYYRQYCLYFYCFINIDLVLKTSYDGRILNLISLSFFQWLPLLESELRFHLNQDYFIGLMALKFLAFMGDFLAPTNFIIEGMTSICLLPFFTHDLLKVNHYIQRKEKFYSQ